MKLSYTQPLLNGAGRAVNESLIVLANIDFNAANDFYYQQLQDHLFQVTEIYWELYRARAEYFQLRKVLHGAESILKNLEGRAEVDALDRQILRARAAVAERRSQIARAKTSIRNAESRLRLLVNDPTLLDSTLKEFTPADSPLVVEIPLSLSDSLSTALANRQDISRAIRDLRSTMVRLGVARNQLLPQLDLIVSGYVAGLEGNADIFEAFVNQFSDGRPGYAAGLNFEVPLGRRAAKAQFERRNWEVNKAVANFRTVVETALTDVEIAVREVHTAYREMAGRYQSMLAASTETRFLIDRFKTLPGLDDSAVLLLEDLLDSQERLADEEAAFVKAQVDYSIAIVKLRQTMGTLFQVDDMMGPASVISPPNSYTHGAPVPTTGNAEPSFFAAPTEISVPQDPSW